MGTVELWLNRTILATRRAKHLSVSLTPSTCHVGMAHSVPRRVCDMTRCCEALNSRTSADARRNGGYEREICQKVGFDEATPCVDVRLHDGIRVQVVLPPISTGGTLLSISDCLASIGRASPISNRRAS